MRSTPFFALALVLLATGCYDETDYDHASADVFNALQVSTSVDSLPADGASEVTVTYQLPIVVDTSLTTITLTCSNGTFQSSGTNELVTNVSKLTDSHDYRFTDVTIIASGVAKPCVVTASISVYERKDTIKFYKAEATAISLQALPFYIRNDTVNEIKLIASLRSLNGIASKGHPVSFTFPTAQGFPQLSQVNSDAVGNATTTFVFTDTTFVGPLNFSASIPGTNVPPALFTVQVIN